MTDLSAPPVVLVVEDEPLLRLHAVDILHAAGFETVEAGSADQAVFILTVRTDIHVVFTDIDMPGSMDGIKLAAAVRDRWPPIEIILTSDYKAPDQSTLPARSVFLPKPYPEDKLVRAVRAFVGAKASEGERLSGGD